MPEGRAERAVEAYAKSMDDAEHSATLEPVMAGHDRDGRTRKEITSPMVRQEHGPTADQIGVQIDAVIGP